MLLPSVFITVQLTLLFVVQMLRRSGFQTGALVRGWAERWYWSVWYRPCRQRHTTGPAIICPSAPPAAACPASTSPTSTTSWMDEWHSGSTSGTCSRTTTPTTNVSPETRSAKRTKPSRFTVTYFMIGYLLGPISHYSVWSVVSAHNLIPLKLDDRQRLAFV